MKLNPDTVQCINFIGTARCKVQAMYNFQSRHLVPAIARSLVNKLKVLTKTGAKLSASSFYVCFSTCQADRWFPERPILSLLIGNFIEWCRFRCRRCCHRRRIWLRRCQCRRFPRWNSVVKYWIEDNNWENGIRSNLIEVCFQSSNIYWAV